MENPLVSILVSYYNDNELLKENIESILKQTYENWELILLNHASTDNSREIAHSFKDPRIKHIDYLYNIGAMSGELYYTLFKQASGKYVKFFSADDKLVPDGIETLVNYMENNPDIDFAFGNVEYIDKNSNSLNDTWFEARPNFSLDYSDEEFLKLYFDINSVLPFAGQIIRKEILKKDNLEFCFILLFDVYLWFSLWLNNNKVGLVNKVIAKYRIHDGQLTALSKREVSGVRFDYECESYRKLMFKIKDINKIKTLCPDSDYINKMTNEKDIQFILAEYFLHKYNSKIGYIILCELLNDEEMSKYIYNKFDFTIGNLRFLYSRMPRKVQIKENWRKIVRRITKDLNVVELLYALLYKLTRNPFKNIDKNEAKGQETKKVKEYSL